MNNPKDIGAVRCTSKEFNELLEALKRKKVTINVIYSNNLMDADSLYNDAEFSLFFGDKDNTYFFKTFSMTVKEVVKKIGMFKSTTREATQFFDCVLPWQGKTLKFWAENTEDEKHYLRPEGHRVQVFSFWDGNEKKSDYNKSKIFNNDTLNLYITVQSNAMLAGCNYTTYVLEHILTETSTAK